MPDNTLKDLQQPTLALIGSLYPMSTEMQDIFVTMLALYERKPTSDNANFLFDKVMGPEDPATKKAWFLEQRANLSFSYCEEIQKQYLQNQMPVPKGLPTSGNLLVGLGVVSRADKDLLMDAQAAARMLDHLENPKHIRLTQELFTQDPSGQVSEARTYLDKPFSTPVQRMEHLCAIMTGYQIVQEPYQKLASQNSDSLMCVPDLSPALNEFHKVAVDTLYRVSEKLSPASAQVASKIEKLALTCAPREDVKDWSFDKIASGMQTILPCLFTWHAPHLDKSKRTLCEDSYSNTERELVNRMIKKRIQQVCSGLTAMHHQPKGYEK